MEKLESLRVTTEEQITEIENRQSKVKKQVGELSNEQAELESVFTEQLERKKQE
jgi:hypothetical protein